MAKSRLLPYDWVRRMFLLLSAPSSPSYDAGHEQPAICLIVTPILSHSSTLIKFHAVVDEQSKSGNFDREITAQQWGKLIKTAIKANIGLYSLFAH